MRENVKAATHEALLCQIQQAVSRADITQAVESAAAEAARALVGQTLGEAPRRLPTPPVAALPESPSQPGSYSVDVEMSVASKLGRNGRKPALNTAEGPDAGPK